jgi:adenylosuccinate synthase
MRIDVILGLQWGDEGKGKIVDFLAPNYAMVCRFQGGPNAGHTLKIDGKTYVLHTVPSGIFQEEIKNLIGNGVVIDPITLNKELDLVKGVGVSLKEKLFVSKKAHLILPTHRLLDAASEAAKGKAKIGSTLRGIGPTYMDKTGRNGVRIGDINKADFDKVYETLKEKHLGLLALYPNIEFDLKSEEEKWFTALEDVRKLNLVDGEYFLNDALREGKPILAEGAQGSMLDIDFGTYPYVTSSNTITSGVCNGLGVAPSKIGEVIGISKAYCTRVGSGPFPTELFDETGEEIRREGQEFGATTGRPRRCGWLDIPQLIYTCMLNGVTQLVVTKLDIFNEFENISIATKYRIDNEETKKLPFDLNEEINPIYESYSGWKSNIDEVRQFSEIPMEAKEYISSISEQLKIPIKYISTGPGRNQIIKI